jgi:cytochrome c-type biogenesis protein CcmH/NrfG
VPCAARCALVGGQRAEAEQIVGLLKSNHAAEIKSVPEVASALAFVELALQAPPDDGTQSPEETIAKLKEAVAQAPGDLEARYTLALKYFQMQRFEDAINQALEVGVRMDPLLGYRHV